jgi:SAM-dependent methyltransferase
LTTYTRDFFETIQGGSRRSAEEMVPLLLALVNPRSVVDVGCGDGTWLSVVAAHGVADVIGIDGAYVDRSRLLIPRDRFVERDLSRPFTIDRAFDLAISLEVGEHLPDSSADGFVRSIASLAPVVAFSAAVPHQTGNHHVNERWPEYWAEAFARHGFAAADVLRPRLWDKDAVEWWYAQNTIVYSRQDALSRLPELAAAAASTDPRRLTRIHPRNYARIGELLAEKERRRNRLTRRIGRLFRRRQQPK